MRPPIVISGRVYDFNQEKNRYEIPFDELDSIRLIDLPIHCHVDITGLALPEHWYSNLHVVNAGDECTDDSISCYGDVTIPCSTMEEAGRLIARIQRVLPDLPSSFIPNPIIIPEGNSVYVFFDEDLGGRGNTLVREGIETILKNLRAVKGPVVTVFLCHASEDKPAARRLARQLRNLGAEVWLDEWEIRVGDSIVEKINRGIGDATHLCLLISSHSVRKPWVSREMSSALMRQLADQSVSILPVRLDETPPPALLADFRYADLRHSSRRYLKDLREALFGAIM